MTVLSQSEMEIVPVGYLRWLVRAAFQEGCESNEFDKTDSLHNVQEHLCGCTADGRLLELLHESPFSQG